MPFIQVVYDHFIMSTHIVFIVFMSMCSGGRKCVSEFADSFIDYCLRSNAAFNGDYY